MRLPLALRAGLGVLAFASLLASAGCGTRIIDLREPPDPDPVPQPTTAVAAVERLEWAWRHRNVDAYRDLFTADFRFECVSDTAAASLVLYREAELEFARRLFQTGGGGNPPAISVSCDIPRPLIEQPGEGGARWSRQVVLAFAAGVRVPNGDYRVLSYNMKIHAVRGDVARIPQELIDAGYRADSTRWWIERWEDSITPARTTPAGRTWTVTTLKASYLDLPISHGPRF